jgi:hypothetical protein
MSLSTTPIYQHSQKASRMITFECVRCYGFRDPPDISHDKNGLSLRKYPASEFLLFENDPSSVGPGVFLWRRVRSLGTHSLFLVLNYPMNLKICNGETPKDTRNPLFRANCVYGSSYSFSSHGFPYVTFWNLQPVQDEPFAFISLQPVWWYTPWQTVMWFKPSLGNICMLIDS